MYHKLDQHANITSNSMFHPSKSIEVSAVFRVLFCNTCVIDGRFVAVVLVFFGYVNCATRYINNFIHAWLQNGIENELNTFSVILSVCTVQCTGIDHTPGNPSMTYQGLMKANRKQRTTSHFSQTEDTAIRSKTRYNRLSKGHKNLQKYTDL